MTQSVEEAIVNDATQTITESQVDANVEESKQDENKMIAQNLLVQAQLLNKMQKQNDRKHTNMIPSLKPAETSKPKVRVTTGDDKPKRGRGRPRKNAEA